VLEAVSGAVGDAIEGIIEVVNTGVDSVSDLVEKVGHDQEAVMRPFGLLVACGGGM
jgi:hypothetical protein